MAKNATKSLWCGVMLAAVWIASACSAQRPGDWIDNNEVVKAYLLPHFDSEVKTSLGSMAEIKGCLEVASEIFSQEERDALQLLYDYQYYGLANELINLVDDAPQDIQQGVWNFGHGIISGNEMSKSYYSAASCRTMKDLFPEDLEAPLNGTSE